ncbi:MAG: GIY-YIG nuclease family protein [Candidatus Peribacteraceae bacterium]|nr:GIY-YIG nuclease family protein [Candidatus Peribacteraceae bacterium]
MRKNRRVRDYFVYILRCADGSYYTGVTNDYQRRLWQHQEGIDPQCYTYKRRPVELVYVGIFGNINEAISWEKKVKRWGRKKKEALIRREFERLPALAKCANTSQYLRNRNIRIRRYVARRKMSVILSSVEG